MSAHAPDVNPVIDGIAGRTLPGSVNVAAIAAMVVGLGAAGYGFAVAGAAWTWGAILVALVYVIGIAQGGVVFAILMTGTWANWGRPIKRIGEALGAFLPIAWLMILVFLIVGGMNIYPWHAGTIIETGPVDLAPHSKEAWSSKGIWLTRGFFFTRQLLGVGLLVALSMMYLRASLRPDLIMAKARLGSQAPAWWDRIIGGGEPLDAAVEKSERTQAVLTPILGALYAVIFSMIAFDLIMSLSPWWYSNMFGGWFFMSSAWLSLCTIGLVAMLARDWLGLKDFVTPTVTHDVGKLMLAFCMFWAYTTFAQLLPIWYTNMPEETDFLMVRMMLPQWSWLSQTVAILCFLAPFTILLSRGIKKMRWPFVGICILCMVGIFMERSLLVMPQVHLGPTFPTMNFIIVNVGVLAGVLGLMTAVVGRVLASTPPLVISDPKLAPHPWDVHVHSLDAASH